MITEHSSSQRRLDMSILRKIDIPERGPFNIPEPYNVRVVRVTNEDDGLINSVGYSYWPNVQVTENYLNVFIGTRDTIKLFSINKETLQVREVTHNLPFHTGEGWFWSRHKKDTLFFYESWGRTLRTYNIASKEIKDIFTVDEDEYIWQLHADYDERRFSFTLRKKPDHIICPAVFKDGRVHKYDLPEGYDECQIFKSGKHLLIKERGGTVNRLINLFNGEEKTLTLQEGSVGHSDNGLDYVVGENRVAQPGGTFWKVGPNDNKMVYHMDWTPMSRHVSMCNAPSNFALVSCNHPDNLPRAKELVLITLDGSLICHPICPTLNTGDEYDDLPKANLSHDGNYVAWTARVNGRRDLFIVEIVPPSSVPIKPPDKKEESRPMSDYDKFVFDEIRRIGKAWVDKNPGENNQEFLFEKIGEMSWRRLQDGKSVRTILEEIGVNPADYGESDKDFNSPTPNQPNLLNYPRRGMSIASLLVNTKHDLSETVKRFVDAGVNSTRINLLSALWPGVNCLPFHQLNNGQWDLMDWNVNYFDRLEEIRDRMNENGIVIQWTNYELYSWSSRKDGPQQLNTPWRNNVNRIFWSRDDITFNMLPNDGWSLEWFKKICPLLSLKINSFEIGNEFPEKALHERVREMVRKIVPGALLQVNRNEDTPGQYDNMKIGLMYDFISLHGNRLRRITDLDRNYIKEPKYKTFNQFIEKCPHDRKRVIFSSDGARISDDLVETYDWEELGEFFDHMTGLGYNIEHQSRAKMTPAPNHHMIETDWFLKRSRR